MCRSRSTSSAAKRRGWGVADFKVEIVARANTDGGYDLQLEADGGIFPLQSVSGRDEALQLIEQSLTAPLAEAEKLKTLDELSTQVQSMVDELANGLERLSQLEQRVSGVDVLAELARLAEALKGGGGGVQVPRPTPPGPGPKTPAGPDRGLRRRELIPHQAVGGAVHRSEAVAEHGEG